MYSLIDLCLFLLFIFLFYVVMYGNSQFHQNDFIRKLYIFIFETIPNQINLFASYICPNCLLNSIFSNNDDDPITKSKTRCKYFVATFFICVSFYLCYLYYILVYPFLDYLFDPKYVPLHKFLFFFLSPWPWIIFILFQIVDPGEIRNDNVESYLKIYPYDNLLYYPKMCPTLHIPIVPRSRFCRFTKKRIA